jgi:hypothetical protein
VGAPSRLACDLTNFGIEEARDGALASILKRGHAETVKPVPGGLIFPLEHVEGQFVSKSSSGGLACPI